MHSKRIRVRETIEEFPLTPLRPLKLRGIQAFSKESSGKLESLEAPDGSSRLGLQTGNPSLGSTPFSIISCNQVSRVSRLPRRSETTSTGNRAGFSSSNHQRCVISKGKASLPTLLTNGRLFMHFSNYLSTKKSPGVGPFFPAGDRSLRPLACPGEALGRPERKRKWTGSPGCYRPEGSFPETLDPRPRRSRGAPAPSPGCAQAPQLSAGLPRFMRRQLAVSTAACSFENQPRWQG